MSNKNKILTEEDYVKEFVELNGLGATETTGIMSLKHFEQMLREFSALKNKELSTSLQEKEKEIQEYHQNSVTKGTYLELEKEYFNCLKLLEKEIDKRVDLEEEIEELKGDRDRQGVLISDLKNAIPPFRVGKKQKRTILDSTGHELGIFTTGQEKIAQLFCDFLNTNNQKTLTSELEVKKGEGEIPICETCDVKVLQEGGCKCVKCGMVYPF